MGSFKSPKMKIASALVVGLVGARMIERDEAGQFLARKRRANEGYFSELKAGNLERECIEEDCDKDEFYEVYDNIDVAGPKYKTYLDCKNYIRKYATDAKEQLRACFEFYFIYSFKVDFS